MNLELVGKEVTPSEGLKTRIEQKLGKLERRVGQQLFARVSLGREGQDYTCTIHFQAQRHDFNATASGGDLFKSTDEAFSRVERQVKKVLHKDEASRKPGSSIRNAAPDTFEEPSA